MKDYLFPRKIESAAISLNPQDIQISVLRVSTWI